MDHIETMLKSIPSFPWKSDKYGLYIWQKENATEGYVIADTHSGEEQGSILAIRGWGYLRKKYGEKEAEDIQKTTAKFVAESPEIVSMLLKSVKELTEKQKLLEETNGRLKKELASITKMLNT